MSFEHRLEGLQYDIPLSSFRLLFLVPDFCVENKKKRKKTKTHRIRSSTPVSLVSITPIDVQVTQNNEIQEEIKTDKFYFFYYLWNLNLREKENKKNTKARPKTDFLANFDGLKNKDTGCCVHRTTAFIQQLQ